METLIKKDNFYVKHTLNLPINIPEIIRGVINQVSEISGFSVNAISSKSRKADLVAWRKIISHICRHNGMTYKAIGLELGGRDHSTIVTNCQTFRDLLDTRDIDTLGRYNMIKHLLK